MFDHVITYDDKLLQKHPEKCVFAPHGGCLIRLEDYRIYEKSKLLSFLSSKKKMKNLSGRAIRHEIYGLLKHSPHVDLYGSIANNRIPYKLPSLKDYMFQLCVENNITDTYFTEKIIDCFVTGTIPIYRGTSKIDLFFNRNGIIRFETMEDLRHILDGLSPELYEQKLDTVKENHELGKKYTIVEDWLYENTEVFC